MFGARAMTVRRPNCCPGMRSINLAIEMVSSLREISQAIRPATQVVKLKGLVRREQRLCLRVAQPESNKKPRALDQQRQIDVGFGDHAKGRAGLRPDTTPPAGPRGGAPRPDDPP